MFDHLRDFLQQENHHFAKNLLIFSGIFFLVLIISFSVMSWLGFIPTEFQTTTDNSTIGAQITESTMEGLGLIDQVSTTSVEDVNPRLSGELPYRITSTSINLDTKVQRPASTNYQALDNALMKGPVYYPGSGLAGKGNLFIFGHSTSYQIVNNKAYQVFNNIKNLKQNDEIKVYSDTRVYTYKVTTVKLVNENEALVTFSKDKNMLTLSTCNSFGQKTDRYVAEANFVSSEAL